jgi:hypothetical protein
MRWYVCGLIVTLTAGTATAQQGRKALELKVAKDDVQWLIGNDLVTDYRLHGYPRPIFWPVNAPGGLPLTRAWPMEKTIPPGGSSDHVHQKSLWFCHGDVIAEGIASKPVDFWSEGPGHGKIVVTSVGKPHVADGHGVLATHNEWRTTDGTKILDEDRTLHCYNVGNARLLVLRIDLNASVVPITFGDTKEGSLGVRINDVIRAGKFGKGKIENAKGKYGEKECWGRIADWCDYSGPIEGKVVGLAVLADAKNAYPTYWHVRDYGLMAANPFGRKKAAFKDDAAAKPLVHLAKGEHLQLRYGILLHEGDASRGQVAEQYQRFLKLREKE